MGINKFNSQSEKVVPYYNFVSEKTLKTVDFSDMSSFDIINILWYEPYWYAYC